jgi:minor extracellular serine protease Vpr
MKAFSSVRLTVFLCVLATSAAAANILVSVNTAGLSGVSGDLLFEFEAGGGPANTASIQNFTGGMLSGSPTKTGTVTGTLPGTTTFNDSATADNEYLQNFKFGTSLTFNLFTTANSPGGNSPDEFSLFLLQSNGMTSLITTSDPFGANTLLTYDIDGSTNGVSTVYTVSSPSGVSATMTPVTTGTPEPGTISLLAAGFCFLIGLRAKHLRALIAACLAMAPLSLVRADTLVNQVTGADQAYARYGVTGKGVIIAILDRGLQYQHPDFQNADGTTRIKAMLDMTGQNFCSSSNPAPIAYTQAQINTALQGGTPVPERDAVGHGTLTAGIAAANGRSFASGKYAGIAPQADLIIIKMTSDGVPAHTIPAFAPNLQPSGPQAAEASFTACYSDALAWLQQQVTAFGQPVAGLINSGVQLWGPIDGTSAVSRNIDQVFGQNHPGWVYVEASGDEGALPTHAGGTYTAGNNTVVNFSKSDQSAQQMALWYTGSQLLNITISMSDGTTVGPLAPPTTLTLPFPYTFAESPDGSLFMTQYFPGYEFYPATSTSGDRFIEIFINGHQGTGTITLTGQGSGTFNIYSDPSAIDTFNDHLVAGNITDYASTLSAISTGAFVVRNSYTDINNVPRTIAGDTVGALWANSAGGPTRDGRIGVAVTTPGENLFATIASNSYWETFDFNAVNDGGGYYSRQGATSGASPITLGAVALMLQMKPDLTEAQAKTLLTTTATSDSFTGTTPNNNWGAGKINIKAALDSLCTNYQGSNVSSQVNVVRGGFRRNPATGHFGQVITVTNTSGSTLAGPLSFVMDSVTNGVTINNAAGNTACLAPLSPYILISSGASLGAGQSATVVVDAINPSNGVITYTSRVLGGIVR